MVPQEDRPLAIGGDVRRLAHDLDDRVAVLLAQRHEHSRHQRKVKRHVAFVAVAEVGEDVGGPLIGLGQKHLVPIVPVHLAANLFDDGVALRQVLAVGPLALDQVRDRVEPHPVHAHVEPEPHHFEEGAQDRRVVEVQVGLVVEEAMPVKRLGDGVPRPVRNFRIGKDDPRARIFGVRVAPDVKVALRGTRRGLPRRLEPRMLIRRVVDDQFRDDPDAALVSLSDELADVFRRAVARVDPVVVGNVVAVVAQRGGVKGEEPDGRDAERLKVIELLNQADEVAHAVIVAVEKRLDVQLVKDGIFVPERVGFKHEPHLARCHDARIGGWSQRRRPA